MVISETVRVNDIYQKLKAETLTAEAEIEALQGKRSALQKALQAENEKLDALAIKEPRFKQLSLMLAAAEHSYSLINEAYEEARIAESRAASELAVLHQAQIPSSPSRPIKILHAGAAFVSSLILAIGAVFLYEFFDSSLRSIDQVEGLLDVPVLATIPPMHPSVGGVVPGLDPPPPDSGSGA